MAGVITSWTYHHEDLEIAYSAAMGDMVAHLVHDGLLTKEEAETWLERHTIVVRRLSGLNRILAILSKKAKNENYILLVAEIVPPREAEKGLP